MLFWHVFPAANCYVAPHVLGREREAMTQAAIAKDTGIAPD
jgi:hypothetical protein